MTRSDDLYSLPPNLPIPVNDGACDHLAGSSWPSVLLRSTRGTYVSLAAVKAVWLVVYCYPQTGLRDKDLREAWLHGMPFLAHAGALHRRSLIAITTPS